MKSGADFSDQNAIKKLAAEDLTSKEISEQLNIVESCVKSFMTYGNDEPEEELEDDDDLTLE